MKKKKYLTPEELEIKLENNKDIKVLAKEAFIDIAKIWGVWGTGMFIAIIGSVLCFALNWIFPWAMITFMIIFLVCALLGYLSQRDWLKYKRGENSAKRQHEIDVCKKEDK